MDNDNIPKINGVEDELFKEELKDNYEVFKEEVSKLSPSLRFFISKHLKTEEDFKIFIDDVFKSPKQKDLFLKFAKNIMEELKNGNNGN